MRFSEVTIQNVKNVLHDIDDSLCAALREKIIASMARQEALLWASLFEPPAHDGPALDLASIDYSVIERRILAHMETPCA